MTRQGRPAVAGVVAVVAAGALTLLAGGCGLGMPGLQGLPKVTGGTGPTYPIDAVFDDVGNLPVDGQVRIGPDVVGHVTAITAAGFTARVALAIDTGVRIAPGTTAQVRFDNPLGDEYVLLDPPTGAGSGGADSTGTDSTGTDSAAVDSSTMAPGSTIPDTATTIAPSIEDTLAALATVLNGGGLNELQSIVYELNQTFEGNQPQIHALLGEVDTAVTSLAAGRASIDGALSAIGTLSASLDAGAPALAGGIKALGPAVTVLAGETTQISSLLTNLSTLGSTADAVIASTRTAAVDDVQALLPVASQLAAVGSRLGPSLAAVTGLETTLPRVIPGDYVQASVTVNVNLPTGDFSPVPVGSAAASAAVAATPSDGADAVTALLEAGLA